VQAVPAVAVIGTVLKHPNAAAPRTEACGDLHASLGTAEGCVAQKISCRHDSQSFRFVLGEIKKAAASSFVTKMPPLIFGLVFSCCLYKKSPRFYFLGDFGVSIRLVGKTILL